EEFLSHDTLPGATWPEQALVHPRDRSQMYYSVHCSVTKSFSAFESGMEKHPELLEERTAQRKEKEKEKRKAITLKKKLDKTITSKKTAFTPKKTTELPITTYFVKSPQK
ncbi:unnamed protein product, partial [Meganyctiphanes norvegica]